MRIAKFDSDSDDDKNVQEDNYAIVKLSYPHSELESLNH